MRATLDFHGFSGGFTMVRQFLSRRWSSSEMLQGVEKDGLRMRFSLYVNRYFLRFRSSLFRGGLLLWLGASGGVWRVSPSCGGVEPLGFKGSDVL
ncbi:hypothetical protein IGI04_021980 [Brassica rapa subsp. trilocularis]|uniref:Uncharacterized protein n=1 Tax=Brassica rapa subsp. trilocularis TaxID=1813537 RepID=A0ABQ7LZM6_BRACM|nr:hypothetical protein IGI04_021980 [Brassica rapa subsp. trilocularis]